MDKLYTPRKSATPVTGVDPERLLSRARMSLIEKQPFFGSIALRLPLVESTMIPTAAVTNGGVLLWNREFINSLTLDECISVVAHEVMHIVQAFFDRTPPNAIHDVWNQAADQVINTAIHEADLSSKVLEEVCPESIRKLVKRDKISEVRYFNLLKEMKQNSSCPACKELIQKLLSGKEQEGNSPGDKKENGNDKGDQAGKGNGENESDNGSGGEGEPQEGEGNGEGSGHSHGKSEHTCGHKSFCYGSGVQATEKNSHDLKMMILEARQQAKERGVSPGSTLETWLDEMLKPKVDWRQYIRAVATAEFKNRYTHRRLSRRGDALNLKLPGRIPDNRSALVFLDTSGSIGKDMLNQFFAECRGILTACGCDSIWLGLHDTHVYSWQKIKAKDFGTIDVRPGGTSHMDCFKIVEGEHPTHKLKEDVAMIICLTDLYSEFPNTCSKKVIWAHPNAEGSGIHVPFGTKVRIEMDYD